MYCNTLSGDVRAYETIRDTIGEKPTDKQEINGDISLLPTVFNIQPVKGKDELWTSGKTFIFVIWKIIINTQATDGQEVAEAFRKHIKLAIISLDDWMLA